MHDLGMFTMETHRDGSKLVIAFDDILPSDLLEEWQDEPTNPNGLPAMEFADSEAVTKVTPKRVLKELVRRCKEEGQ